MALHSSGHNITKTLTVPDDIALPLVPTDYLTIDLCTKALREGRLGVAAAQNFLYCSILVPHPPYVDSPVAFGLPHRLFCWSLQFLRLLLVLTPAACQLPDQLDVHGANRPNPLRRLPPALHPSTGCSPG